MGMTEADIKKAFKAKPEDDRMITITLSDGKVVKARKVVFWASDLIEIPIGETAPVVGPNQREVVVGMEGRLRVYDLAKALQELTLSLREAIENIGDKNPAQAIKDILRLHTENETILRQQDVWTDRWDDEGASE